MQRPHQAWEIPDLKIFGGWDNIRVLLYTYALFLLFPRLIAVVVGDRMLGWIDLNSYKYSHSYVHNCMLPYNSEK